MDTQAQLVKTVDRAEPLNADLALSGRFVVNL